jgi:hypothetical protein
MPRDCLILGSGRSGTSFAAGMLSRAGYFMGDKLWPGNIGNPRGYFEDREITSINEELLAPLSPARGALNKLLRRNGCSFGKFQRWLAVIPPGARISCPARLSHRIGAATARRPFCFKDPRFCYTLPIWRPYVGHAALICVFRHPGVTANSILTECARSDYLRGVKMDFQGALAVWEMMYRHVLEINFPAGGDWLFLHYDQLMDGTAATRIERLLEMQTDRSFADAELKRSTGVEQLPDRITSLYERLCGLAGL